MLQILIYGAVSSAIYAMLAVGFTLIFGVARILNLAHGSFYALGAYAAYVLTSLLNVPLFLAAPIAVLLVALFGVVMERFLVRPLRSSQLAVLMITLAVSLAVEQALFIIFGSEYRNVPSFVADKVSIGGVDIGGQRLLALVAGVLVSADPVAVHSAHATGRSHSGGVAGSGSRAVHGHSHQPHLLDRDGDLGRHCGSCGCSGVTVPHRAADHGPAADGEGVRHRHRRRPRIDPGQHHRMHLILGYSETIVAYLISTSWTELVSLVAVVITLMIRPSGILGRRAAF